MYLNQVGIKTLHSYQFGNYKKILIPHSKIKLIRLSILENETKRICSAAFTQKLAKNCQKLPIKLQKTILTGKFVTYELSPQPNLCFKA